MDARRIGGIRAGSSPCVVESQGFSRGKAKKRCSPGVGYDDRALWDEIPIVPIVLPDMSVISAGEMNAALTPYVRLGKPPITHRDNISYTYIRIRAI
jgi:hypothetical protein